MPSSWTDLLADSASFVVLSGAAGMGKTSMLVTAAGIAESHGIRTLRARGSALEREYAFGLVRQLLEPLLVAAGDRERWLSGAAAAGAAVLTPQTDDKPVSGEFAVEWAVLGPCCWGEIGGAIDGLCWRCQIS